jgi:phosphate transport system substrate-binding protein
MKFVSTLASKAALRFFKFAFEKGAKMAEDLDYVPMPEPGGQADRADLVV